MRLGAAMMPNEKSAPLLSDWTRATEICRLLMQATVLLPRPLHYWFTAATHTSDINGFKDW